MLRSYGCCFRVHGLDLQHEINLKILIEVPTDLKFIIAEISTVKFVQFCIFEYFIEYNIFMGFCDRIYLLNRNLFVLLFIILIELLLCLGLIFVHSILRKVNLIQGVRDCLSIAEGMEVKRADFRFDLDGIWKDNESILSIYFEYLVFGYVKSSSTEEKILFVKN